MVSTFHRTTKLGAVVAAALFVLASLASPATASTYCDYNASSSFAGYVQQPDTAVFGVRARIEYNSPSLCQSYYGSVGASVIWSMVAADSLSHPNNRAADGWAQSGYGNFGVNSGEDHVGPGTFAQWTTKCKSLLSCGTNPEFRTKIVAAPAGTAFYSTFRRASTGLIEMWAAGVKLTEMNYNTQGVWNPAWSAQYAAETKDVGDDVSGTTADKTLVDYMQFYESDGSLTYASGLVKGLTPGTRYHVQWSASPLGGKQIETWTDPLS